MDELWSSFKETRHRQPPHNGAAIGELSAITYRTTPPEQNVYSRHFVFCRYNSAMPHAAQPTSRDAAVSPCVKMTRPIVVLISLVICTLTVSAYATALGSPVVKEACRVAPERWVRGARADVDSLVEVIVAVKQSNGAELERILLDVSDPDSPRYGQHLARDAVDKLVAPAADDIMAVLMWLKDAGVDMDNVEATGNSGAYARVASTMWWPPVGASGVWMSLNAAVVAFAPDFITVVTTIGVAERLLGGVYYTWTHKEHPTFTVTRLGDCHYSMPARVAKAVDFVGPTIRFPAVQTTTTATSPGKQLNDDDFGGVTPSFLRKLYKVGDAVGHAANNNQSVASFLGQYYSPSDLQTFFGQFAPYVTWLPCVCVCVCVCVCGRGCCGGIKITIVCTCVCGCCVNSARWQQREGQDPR